MRLLVLVFGLSPLWATLAAADDWHDLLKQPISPGSVVALAWHSKEPEVLDRWAAASGDQSPRTRAAAARVANVSGAASLVPALVTALQRESDPEAGSEEIRALAALGSAATDDVLFTAAEKLGPWAPALARRFVALRSHPFEAIAQSATPPIRMIARLPEDVLAGLLAVTKCRPSTDRPFAGAMIAYDAAGRPRNLSYLKSELSPACELAAESALAVAFDLEGSNDTRIGEPQVVLVVLDPDVTTCPATVAGSASGQPVHVGDAIKEPRKVRNINPRYPESARSSRVEGVVVMEARISVAGCIESLQVVRSPDMRLSLSAVNAVSGWRYTPTLLNGMPAPVIMTITVNFRLN